MIIERKFSAVQPPLDAWPNVRAQLWAYSQIDDWLDVEDVTLVGEVWNWERDSYVLRATHRWSRDDKEFTERNCELFGAYGGVLE